MKNYDTVQLVLIGWSVNEYLNKGTSGKICLEKLLLNIIKLL